MVVDIGEIQAVGFSHALNRAIYYVNIRLCSGFNSPHPERRDMGWYRNAEDDLDVAKTLKVLLDMVDKAKPRDGKTEGGCNG